MSLLSSSSRKLVQACRFWRGAAHVLGQLAIKRILGQLGHLGLSRPQQMAKALVDAHDNGISSTATAGSPT